MSEPVLWCSKHNLPRLLKPSGCRYCVRCHREKPSVNSEKARQYKREYKRRRRAGLTNKHYRLDVDDPRFEIAQKLVDRGGFELARDLLRELRLEHKDMQLRALDARRRA